MLEISVHKIAQIILYGRELARGEGELRGFLESLDEDENASLVAVMWIGRGTFDPEDYADAVETAYREANTPTADYLIGTPNFVDHLESGLEALGLSAAEEEEALL